MCDYLRTEPCSTSPKRQIMEYHLNIDWNFLHRGIRIGGEVLTANQSLPWLLSFWAPRTAKLMRRSRFHPRRPPFDSRARQKQSHSSPTTRTGLLWSVLGGRSAGAGKLVHWSIILEHAVSAYYDVDKYGDQRQGLAFKRALRACTQGVSVQDDVIFCAV